MGHAKLWKVCIQLEEEVVDKSLMKAGAILVFEQFSSYQPVYYCRRR